jgi:hypothetical protein
MENLKIEADILGMGGGVEGDMPARYDGIGG